MSFRWPNDKEILPKLELSHSIIPELENQISNHTKTNDDGFIKESITDSDIAQVAKSNRYTC